MARLPRLDMPGIPQHLVQRGNNKQAIFFHEDDYGVYLEYLREALDNNGCKLHAFVLMTNHVHLLATGVTAGAISGLMQSVGRRYVRYINASYKRTGTLFEGRFKSSLIGSERYLLTCMRYIELNPVRAGMVDAPAHYRWSSVRHHIGEEVIAWLSDPKEYRRLGRTVEDRAMAYRALFDEPLASNDLQSIRDHLNKDCVLGSSKFQDEIAAMLGRRARIVPQGRPKRVGERGEM